MGVKACARRNCTQIMCDRYSPEHGYICEDCFEEMHSSALALAGCITSFMMSSAVKKDDKARKLYFNMIFPKD